MNEKKDCEKEQKRKKEILFWLNPASITLIVFIVLSIIVIIIEAIEWKTWEIHLIQIFIFFIIGGIIFLIVVWFWSIELYMSSWTLTFSPFISILPVILLLGYRKVKIDGSFLTKEFRIVA